MRSILFPLSLLLAFGSPQQPAGQDPATPPRRSGFETAEEAGARLREALLGAWQLTRGEIPAYGVSSGGVAGYAIFIEGYMSFELHIVGKNAFNAHDYFQTGTHRWRLDDLGKLETYSLIGTNNSLDVETFDFELPGVRREYKVRIEEERLVLERHDRTARFTFMRLGKMRFPDASESPALDFYGRPIKPPPAEGEKGEKKGG